MTYMFYVRTVYMQIYIFLNVCIHKYIYIYIHTHSSEYIRRNHVSWRGPKLSETLTCKGYLPPGGQVADSAQDLVETCDVVLSLGLPGEDVAPHFFM